MIVRIPVYNNEIEDGALFLVVGKDVIRVRCEDCKWWDDFAGAKNRGSCIRVEQEGKAELGFSLGASADLYTDPDFGCLQWEAKDA